MHPHEALVRRFYASLAARDAEAALRCCHADLFYSDPRHPRLHGAAALDLWRMRLDPDAGYEVTLEEASGGAEGVLARWTARSRARGRSVAMPGRAMFAFRDGLISRHYDDFSLWRWAAQVWGPAGMALGWFGPFRWALRQRAARALERFSAARARGG